MICPGTRRPFAPVKPWRSDPQIPVAITASSTSPRPATGSGRSWTAIWWKSSRTSAYMGRSLVGRVAGGRVGESEAKVDVDLGSGTCAVGSGTGEDVRDVIEA